MKRFFLILLLAVLAVACKSEVGVQGKPAGGPPGGGGGGSPCATCANVTPAQPVILVHGRNDTKARWDALVSSWSSRGYTENTNLFRIDMATDCGGNDYCSVLGSYPASTVNESYAKCLEAFIASKVPSGEVDIVAHSIGTLTTRYYARFLQPSRVNDMVLMAGPLQGMVNCTLAGACGGVNPEACPDSDLMRKLNGVAPQGDGSNDETPNASVLGPIHYSTTIGTKDTVINPYCSGYLITNPQTTQGDDMNCRTPNFTIDPDSTTCVLSLQHLVVPTDTNAINDAYCQVNAD